MPGATCKHCGEGAEVVAGPDSQPVVSDSCYGCRNRWREAKHKVARAVLDIQQAQELLELEGGDNEAVEIADLLVRETTGLPSLLKRIEEIA